MSYGKRVKRMVVIITIVCIIVILVALLTVVCVFKKGNNSNIVSSASEETAVGKDFVEEEVDPSLDSVYNATFESQKYEAKNSKDEVTVVNERNVLMLNNEARPKAASIIQDTINGIMNDKWDNDIKRAADDYSNSGNKDEVKGVKYICELVYQNSSFLTFSIKISGELADSSLASDELYTFSSKTGERLSIDLCANNAEELKSELIQATQQYIKDNNITIKDSLNVGERELLANNMSRQGNFGILESGICIKYQKNEIADESAGVISVSLNKNRSNSLMKSGYKID